ncbi:MAG: mce5A [Marmoricola sp.]|nr:mce5A [Marmoricola sp.]
MTRGQRKRRDDDTEVRSAFVGILAIVVAFGLIALSTALFKHSFTSTESLTLRSDRAGLLMSKGAMVKLRGVEIGRVGEVSEVAGGAQLRLDIDSKYLSTIPANVAADIVPTTVFGNKYVELVPPAQPGPAIAAGSVVTGQHVTVEVNNTFESLVNLLNGVEPRQINAALTSLASSLQDNGAQAGQFIDLLNTYLGEINPQLPLINADITQGVGVAGQYADLAPNLVRLAGNGTTISDTLVANRASLDALLVSFSRLADKTGTLAKSNEKNLAASLTALDPTTKLLAKYSPEFPCLLEGLAISKDMANKAFGAAPGVQPGINGYIGLLPSQEPYQNPRDLPEINAKNGPGCYGLPNVTVGKIPHPTFDSGGPDPYAGDIPGGGSAGTKGGLGPVYTKQFLGVLFGLGNFA